jgi:hypothetical protein
MQKLQIKDIYFGKIDGYNEFLEYGQDTCKGLFYEFPNIDISRLLDGSTYYIFGNKGTGKTMLLKYLESVISENPSQNFSEFIRFKRDIDEEERNQIKRSAIPNNPFEEIVDSEVPSDFTLNCSLAWQVYLIKVIISRLSETEYGVFDRNTESWEKLCALLNAAYGELENCSVIKKILPKMKRGNIEIDTTKIIKANLEFEWVDSEKKIVSFTSLAKQIINLYSELSPVEDKIYIFIDELELAFKQTKKYQRDVTLIRDLIFAIEYLSDINRTHSFNVFLVTAIRTEVYKNIISKGLEINKTIHDFGITISWEQKGGNIRNHPLLKMLEKRIHFSETKFGYEPSSDIWETYFMPYVGRNKKEVQNYILDQTWYKPRDIIRLFSIIQQHHGNKNIIDQECFDTARKPYAEESWIEFEEFLTVKYSDREVEGIKKALTGMQLPFLVSDFQHQLNIKKDFFDEVDELVTKRKTPDILKDLYDIGIIGNYGSNSRFTFKGDTDIDPIMPITIHYPLIKFFQASINYSRENRS